MAYTGQRDSAAVCSVPNTERLEQMLDQAGFALLVLTAESERTDGVVLARQNVVHETGLFQGRLGWLAVESPPWPYAAILANPGRKKRVQPVAPSSRKVPPSLAIKVPIPPWRRSRRMLLREQPRKRSARRGLSPERRPRARCRRRQPSVGQRP